MLKVITAIENVYKLQFQSLMFVCSMHGKRDIATPRKYYAFLNINSVALFFSSKNAGLNAVSLER